MVSKVERAIAKKEISKIFKYLFEINLRLFLRQIRVCIDFGLFLLQRGKAIKLLYPPRHISIMLCGFCSNRCIFCAHHSDASRADPRTKHFYKLPFAISFRNFRNIVDKAYKARVPAIHLCGAGEPTIHPDFVKMLDYVIGKFSEVSFQSNLTKEIWEKKNLIWEVKKRAKHISYITTDILSVDPKLHEKIKLGSKWEDMLNIMAELSKAGILFHVHNIVTKHNYKDMDKLVEELHRRKINFRFDMVNLDPYNFNDFTSLNSPYMSADKEMAKEIEKAIQKCEELGILYSAPVPYDKKIRRCTVFWDRLQVNYPSHDLPKEQWLGNCLPGACNAVVTGKMRTIGNLYYAKDLWEVWNNETLQNIRRDLINNKFPDKECINCQFYKKE